MKYKYLLPSLLMAGVLVIAVDAPAATSKKARKSEDKEERASKPRRIPPQLVKLKLNKEQEEKIRFLLNQAEAELHLAGKDKAKRKAATEKRDRMLNEILTAKQRAELKRLRSGSKKGNRF